MVLKNVRGRVWLVSSVLALLCAVPLGAQEDPARAGWLGFSYVTGKGDAASAVRIERVYPGSPAARAGMRGGDLIVRWDGAGDVTTALKSLRLEPGDTVRLRVRRDGDREREIQVVAARRPSSIAVAVPGGGRRPPGIAPEEWERLQEELRRSERDVARALRQGVRIGAAEADSLSRAWGVRIRVDSLAFHADSLHKEIRLMLRDSLGPQLEQLREQLRSLTPRAQSASVTAIGTRSVAGAEFEEMNAGLSNYFGTDEGALVLRVSPGTPAARSGLRPGDVVLEANDQEIESVPDLRDVLVRAQRSRTRSVVLEIVRERQRQELELRWE